MAEEKDSGVDVGAKLISEINEEAYDLRIESLKGQLECRASIEVHDTENSISPAEMINLLKMLDISEALDLEQLAIFCTSAANGENPQEFPIAHGIEPTQGKDGYFELLVDVGGENIELEEDEQGRVDYKSIKVFTNVEEGQVLGNIIPPEKGLPGKTVVGTPVPAPPGKPASIRAGIGAEISGNGTEIVATTAGRITFDGRIISVVEEFVVSGDVDLQIGHINFNGFVEIKGDVLDDFNIKATKGISVSGTVGACKLETDGPITIGTMAGMGIGLVRCKGDFTARYLNQATVECWGNIFIENEVRNSVLKATGSICAPKGMVTGGETVAMEGIEAKNFGSRSGVKTLLTAGIYFPEADRLHFLRSQLKSIAYQLKKISETLPALQRKPLDKMRKALREAIELRIGILTERQVNLTEEREVLSEELANFQAEDHPTANPKINALNVIKEGVIFHLNETVEEVKNEINGPVTIIENPTSREIRQLTYSPLQVTAEELEEDLSDEVEDPAPANASNG